MHKRTWKLIAVTASAAVMCTSMSIIAIKDTTNLADAASQQDEVSQQQTQISDLSYTSDNQQDQEQPSTAAEQTSAIKSYDWGADDSECLLKIAMAEAEGEDVEGKALVILVVLNRVWSDDFPGTIQEVIFQEDQFSVTKSGGRYWTCEPDAGCYAALTLISKGWDESDGALYFESCDGSSWHSRNLEQLFTHGNHKFYK